MKTGDMDWRKDLRQDLLKIFDHYTPESHSLTVDTQRDYQQSLMLLEEKYSDRLDHILEGRRLQYDIDFRNQQRSDLHAVEAEGQKHARHPNDLWALRTGLTGHLKEIAEAAYRNTDAYKDGMQQLSEERVAEQEMLDKAFDRVERDLNDRFGFRTERAENREDERNG